MSGAPPDLPEPARDPDAASRLRLAQAVQRAQYAIAWEQSWPHLARLLTVVGLFLRANVPARLDRALHALSGREPAAIAAGPVGGDAGLAVTDRGSG